MPTWNPEQYMRFSAERTRPSRELAAAIPKERANSIIDLGCGPGNSTATLVERWPKAAITGLDSSTEMLGYARKAYPQHQWIYADIPKWAATDTQHYDIVFSSAALQWIPDHQTLFPSIIRRVAIDGVLAVQIPYNCEEPFHRILCDLEASSFWRQRLPARGVRARLGNDVGVYYDILSPISEKTNIWDTRYTLALPGVESIVDWLRGTALRPFLDALPEADREGFVGDYTDALRSEYKPRTNGSVLFPFRRLFLIATR
jgi:trans-aconitate 2-methyltransferase